MTYRASHLTRRPLWAVAVAVGCLGATTTACSGDPDTTDEPATGKQVASESASSRRLAETGEPCGGFAGFVCVEGNTCIDDPSDSCDPDQGGRDCIGICVRK